jgi:chromosomal replication initiation ATPase DnaA
VSRATGITEKRFYSTAKDRRGARGSGVVGYLARKISGYMVKEIADYFRRSPIAIGEAITKVEGLLRKDTSFEKALKRMRENVVKGKKRKYRVSVA